MPSAPLRLAAVLLLLVATLILAACAGSGTAERSTKLAGQSVATAVSHEAACPIKIARAEAALSDTTLSCLVSIRSMTRSPISSFVLRCALKDTCGGSARPVAAPAELTWVGSLAPADTVSSALSVALRFSQRRWTSDRSECLLAEFEPQEVSYEGERRWTRSGPVAQ